MTNFEKLLLGIGVLGLVLMGMLGFNQAFADTTLSRDGEGTKINGPAYGSIRSTVVGTKGFKCWSTNNKIAWELKITNGTDATALPFKYFINNNETVTYPVSDKFFQWNNSPVSKTLTITKACLRPYSSAVQKTAHGAFQ